MTSDQSPDQTDRTVRSIVEASDEPEGGPIYRSIVGMGPKEIAFVAWVVTAGAYGYLVSEYGNTAVDVASSSPYPENAWVFMLLGLGIGVGMYASFQALEDDDDE